MKEMGRCAAVSSILPDMAVPRPEGNIIPYRSQSIRSVSITCPPYEAGIKAGAGMVMTSFNTVNDIPATINQKLMRPDAP